MRGRPATAALWRKTPSPKAGFIVSAFEYPGSRESSRGDARVSMRAFAGHWALERMFADGKAPVLSGSVIIGPKTVVQFLASRAC